MHQHQFDYGYREFWLRLTWKELIITNHLASTLLFMYCQTGVGLTGLKGAFEAFERRTTGWHKSRCCDLLALTNILFVSKASESNALLMGFDDWHIIHLTDQIVRLLKKKKKKKVHCDVLAWRFEVVVTVSVKVCERLCFFLLWWSCKRGKCYLKPVRVKRNPLFQSLHSSPNPSLNSFGPRSSYRAVAAPMLIWL